VSLPEAFSLPNFGNENETFDVEQTWPSLDAKWIEEWVGFYYNCQKIVNGKNRILLRLKLICL